MNSPVKTDLYREGHIFQCAELYVKVGRRHFVNGEYPLSSELTIYTALLIMFSYSVFVVLHNTAAG